MFSPHSSSPGPQGQLFIVADGMGGHRGGKEASLLAVDIVGKEYFANAEQPPQALRDAMRTANTAIRATGEADPSLQGMGTTCTALVLHAGSGFIGHIGDSRAYRIAGGAITQLTQDHTLVADLERRGVPPSTVFLPSRSVLYRALGIEEEPAIDLSGPISANLGDTFLLCSDGLFQYATDEELLRTAQQNTPEIGCRFLIDLANQRGGEDNITVGIIRITEDPA
jgi:protein phosphatase